MRATGRHILGAVFTAASINGNAVHIGQRHPPWFFWELWDEMFGENYDHAVDVDVQTTSICNTSTTRRRSAGPVDTRGTRCHQATCLAIRHQEYRVLGCHVWTRLWFYSDCVLLIDGEWKRKSQEPRQVSLHLAHASGLALATDVKVIKASALLLMFYMVTAC